jgi:hypothetical protein
MPLDAAEVLLFFFLLDLALMMMNGEGVVLNPDIAIFFFDCPELQLEIHGVLVLIDGSPAERSWSWSALLPGILPLGGGVR